MSKPHIGSASFPKSTTVHYFIDDNWIGSTWVHTNGTFFKSNGLRLWLNNPENVKKYLKTPIK